MRVADAYRLLEIEPGATDDEVRRAWRDMTKVWHPDRFAHDAELQRKAQEKLKEINGAYETIMADRAGGGGWRRRPADEPRSDEARSGPAWKVRSGGREWPAANLEMILGWAASGRIPPDAEVFDPGTGNWSALDSIPGGPEAFAQVRMRRYRRWGFYLVAIGIFFLLRRPTLGGIILAAACFASAMILFWRAR
jgi:hypothetical protein